MEVLNDKKDGVQGDLKAMRDKNKGCTIH